MPLEQILELIESELKHRKFRNQLLQETVDKLTEENADLKLKIAELEKYIEEKEW